MTCTYCKDKLPVYFYLPNFRAPITSGRITGFCGECAELADTYMSMYNMGMMNSGKGNGHKETSSEDSKTFNSQTENGSSSNRQEG